MADRLNIALVTVARQRKWRAASVAFVVGALGSTYLFALAHVVA